MRIALAWWFVAMAAATLTFSLVPGHPAHGYGHLWFGLPLLFWFYRPAQRRRLLLYISGILLQLLAYPDIDLGFFGWVLLWPYLWARAYDDNASWWRAAFLFGFLRAHAGYYWLGNIHFTAWIGVSAGSSFLFVLCFEAVLRYARFLPFALRAATGWALFEWAHSWFFGGFPWLYLAHSQYRYLPLIQAADLVGAAGISFVMAYVSAAAWEWLRRGRKHAELAPAAILLAALAAYGFPRGELERGEDGPGVLMVQSGISFSMKARGLIRAEEMLDRLTAQTAKGLAAHPDTSLIVWPETMFPYVYVEQPPYDAHFLDAARKLAVRFGLPVIYGVNTYSDYARYKLLRGHNSAVLVDAGGRVRGTYRKQRLVPMGEEFLPRLLFSEETCDAWKRWLVRNLGYPESSDLEAGERFVTLDAGPGLRCAMLICFEGLYGADARAALEVGEPDMILHLSNNGWFGPAWEQRQSVASWVFRAIETRTPFLSCANGGITCAVAPNGALAAYLDLVMEDGYLGTRVPRRWSAPLFRRGGHLVLPVGLALACGLCALRGRFGPHPPAEKLVSDPS